MIVSNAPLLEGWNGDEARRMNEAIFVARHRLSELDLFSDEGLLRTIEKHPRESLGINSMGSDPARREEWREGLDGGLSAADLLESVRKGRVWLNLRRMMDCHREYAELVDRLYDEMEGVCPGLKTFNRSANLLISSPTALVYFHVDCPQNILWHLRGEKRVWAYPLESGVVDDETLEAVLAGDKSEEVEYRTEMDKLAKQVDLKPGDMITWPQHTPHRVTNTSGLNVSLSTEHMTRGACRKNNVYLANRHFRGLTGCAFRSTKTSGIGPALKEAALRVARRVPPLAPQPPRGFEYPKTFTVDLAAPDCVRLHDQEAPQQEAAPAVAITLPLNASVGDTVVMS